MNNTCKETRQLIRKLADPQLKNKDAERLHKQLRKILRHPGDLASCQELPSTDLLRREAQVVSDAFQAVTNGMRDEELMIQLNGIPVGSVLYPWKSLVLAVDLLYRGERLEACQSLSLVEQDTPPGRLALLLLCRLSPAQNPPEDLNCHEQEFLNLIFRQNPLLVDVSHQLESCIEEELDEILLDTVTLYLKELKRIDRKIVLNAALWCAETLLDKDLLDQEALVRYTGLFGRNDSYRIFALATMKAEPARSLFFWLGSLEAAEETEMPSLSELKAYLRIIEELWRKTADVFQLSEEFSALFDDRFVHLFQKIFTGRHQQYPVDGLNIEDKIELARNLLSDRPTTVPDRKKQIRVPAGEIKEHCKQLELVFG